MQVDEMESLHEQIQITLQGEPIQNQLQSLSNAMQLVNPSDCLEADGETTIIRIKKKFRDLCGEGRQEIIQKLVQQYVNSGLALLSALKDRLSEDTEAKKEERDADEENNIKNEDYDQKEYLPAEDFQQQNGRQRPFTKRQSSYPRPQLEHISLNENSSSNGNNSIAHEDVHHRKYQILSPKRIEELRHDLQAGLLCREELVQKYAVSVSTILRDSRATTLSRVSKIPIPLPKAQHHTKSEVKPMNEPSERNTAMNIHLRYLFMKQYVKYEEYTIIYVDELAIRLQVNEQKSTSTRQTKYGLVEEVNVIMALGSREIMHWKLKHKKITQAEFVCFLEDIVKKFPGLVVFMDNHSLHKGEAVAEAISNLNLQVLFLPPSSPELNPIANFYVDFRRILATRLKPDFGVKDILQETHKLFTQLRYKNDRYFQKNEQFREMAAHKKQFPEKV